MERDEAERIARELAEGCRCNADERLAILTLIHELHRPTHRLTSPSPNWEPPWTEACE